MQPNTMNAVWSILNTREAFLVSLPYTKELVYKTRLPSVVVSKLYRTDIYTDSLMGQA